MSETQARKALRRYRGFVTRKSGDQTLRVQMDYFQKHPKYHKLLKRRTIAHVHDDRNEAKIGDWVEICKCRPISKTKQWRLLKVLDEQPVMM